MDILEKLILVIKEAGASLLKYYENEAVITYKENDQPVTDADLASQKIIIEGLSSFGYPICSEELENDLARLKADKVWIVDPMDGTKDFIERTGEFCVMIALIEKGEPVLGAIYKPVGDILYFAQKGKGAFRRIGNGKDLRLSVSSVDDPNKATMLLSRHHLQPAEVMVAEKLGIKKCIPCGSAGVKAGLIASGKAELYIVSSDTTSEWDACAGDIIIRESGGQITDTKGNKLIYNKKKPTNPRGFIVSNGLIHSAVVRELNI